jgi:aerobic C4-dicarboxylate transport protein
LRSTGEITPVRILKQLYVQVLIGILAGIAVGYLYPDLGILLKPLGDAFIKLVKLVIAPVIFCTVATGIARMSDLRAVGRVGGKALLYFELMSTFALGLGLLAGHLLQPGRGFNINSAALDPSIAAAYVAKASHSGSITEHLMGLIPDTFVGAFAEGNLLQVLFLAILIGFACTRTGQVGHQAASFIEAVGKLFFAVIHIVVLFAPIGAFGAMGFTIGKYGIHSLVQLSSLVGAFYFTSAMFVLVVLGGVALLSGFSIIRFLNYIREELLIVLGTSSSESVLPQMMEKMVRLGASAPVAGLVIPTGYSFNLDGTNIYMTLATLFLAQATNTHLSWGQELALLAVAMLTSKGASGVTGAGFIVLAATLTVAPQIPIAALAVLVGVDRFMSQCRALTNLIGNGVATLVVARWEGQLDRAKLRLELERGPFHVETIGTIGVVSNPVL